MVFIPLAPKIKKVYAIKAIGLILTIIGFAFLLMTKHMALFLIGLILWITSIVYGFYLLKNNNQGSWIQEPE